MDNEPLSNVDRYGEVDGPLPFLPNANFMPHWFFQWVFFYFNEMAEILPEKKTKIAQTLP